ncbi:protein MAIN-LIKE 1-like [Vicia villosa]|uniref:protein MAIN-LIKE 1-like n=1 Tax=Vicia villosa TaxID=3911 RepID=UPI00273C4AD4|nr:protein MAIN-LIKE 1-like [Vicia villosa]
MAILERWHPETSYFHLPHGEITITLDDVACLLNLPIKSTLLGYDRLTKEEVMEMMIEELGASPADALEKVERTRGAHVRFHFLQRIYDAELLAAHEAVGDEAEVNIHRERVLRCYFLYLIGTQLFVYTSSTYTEVAYLAYLSDLARVHEYNWGADTLAYNYHILGVGCLWKERSVAGSCTLLVGCILQQFPDIIGWGEVLGYTATMSRAIAFAPLRGNQVSDPYKRCLDCMV